MKRRDLPRHPAAWALVATLGLALALPTGVEAQTCGYPAGGTLANVLNAYYPGVGTAASGAKTITVDKTAITGSASRIAAGQMLVVMQMQQAQINATNDNNYGSNTGTGNGATAVNNSGFYEYIVATTAVVGNAFTFVGAGATNGLINTYTTAASTGARGQQSFQVILVPQYSSATLGGTFTASAWNGRTGGVLAVDVSGVLALGGATVSVDGLGFRGGPGQALGGDGGAATTDYVQPSTTQAHGMKAEGIAGTPSLLSAVPGGAADGYPNGDMARGAPATAGGGGTDGNPGVNDQNTGGGGGANGGAGGGGGWGWPGTNVCPPVDGSQTGGIGGAAFGSASSKVVLGAGGGAGSRNNNGPSDGGAGGGVVLIRAGQISGTGTITANGLRPLSTANDGAGGGGAGGSIVFVAATGTLTGLTVQAHGGQGGWANLPSPPAPDPPPAGSSGVHHGPGGGGGGGAIFLSSAATSSTVTGGQPGSTDTCATDTPPVPITYHATAGANGTVTTGVTALPGVQPCTLATRAAIAGLRVDPSGSVEFATGTQRRTVAFNVYATEDPSGRGARRRLNPKPIAAPVTSSAWPILYRAATRPVTTPYVLIEEVELGGHHRMMGPFPVGDAPLERSFARLEARSLTHETVERAGAVRLTHRLREAAPPRPAEPPQSLPSGESALKIEVAQAGPVRIAGSDLVAQGLPAERALASLRLTNLGRSVPFSVQGSGASAALLFEAEALATDYSGRNVYVLSWGSQAPPPSVAFTRSGFPRIPGSVRVEQNNFYAPFVPQGADPWIWDLLVSGQGPTSYTFDLPNLKPGSGLPVRVRVGVAGGSAHVHTVEASLNGASLGRTTFTGEVQASLAGVVAAEAVLPAGNQLTLTYTAEVSGPQDTGLLFFDVVDLSAPVTEPTQPVPVQRIAPYIPKLPSDPNVDYLIVTHARFADQARRLAGLKELEGYRVAVVDVERGYDLFSSGVFEARSVQALIRRFGQSHRLRYVLLLGDDTFDPRNFAGSSPPSLLPSLYAFDGEFGRVPSENLYAALEGDLAPDVAIGRLPALTEDEANLLVDKVARQASVVAAAGKEHLIALDNQGPEDISFRGEAESLVATLPEGSSVSWADLAEGLSAARGSLLSGLGQGPLATHYFGHGGQEIWSNAELLTKDDVAHLPMDGRETVLFTWTCETQWYVYEFRPVINEAFLLLPRGGALATLGPTGITDPKLQGPFFQGVYSRVFRGMSLGEAVRRAKVEALKADPASRTVVEGWSLLGDPSLRLVTGVPAP